MDGKRAIGSNEIDREAMMREQEQRLSAEQCVEMAQALLQEAAGMPEGARVRARRSLRDPGPDEANGSALRKLASLRM